MMVLSVFLFPASKYEFLRIPDVVAGHLRKRRKCDIVSLAASADVLSADCCNHTGILKLYISSQRSQKNRKNHHLKPTKEKTAAISVTDRLCHNTFLI